MKYDVFYEHLKDEIFANNFLEFDIYTFNYIKEESDGYGLELSDNDFINLYKIKMNRKDAGWLMHQMSCYDKTLLDALVAYITW